MTQARIVRWILLIVVTLTLAASAAAERFHVRTGGERLAGPSDAGDWFPPNCYADLVGAQAAAAAGDSVLFYREAHQESEPLALTVGFVVNMDLDSDHFGTSLELGDTGQITVTAGLAGVRLQGLTLAGGTDQRTIPGFVTPLGLLDLDLDGRIMPVDDPVLTAGPNPFNPRTVLARRLAAPATVRLDLHDARGRLVRTLWSGPVAAGEHRWTWDGRDTGGRDCASGVYLTLLQLDGRAADMHKLTLVR